MCFIGVTALCHPADFGKRRRPTAAARPRAPMSHDGRSLATVYFLRPTEFGTRPDPRSPARGRTGHGSRNIRRKW